MTFSVFLLVVGIMKLATCEHIINERPIIGILSQESTESLKPFGPTYIPASYVKYIESAGARVVPILVNQTESYYIEMFKSLNGVLWPGGDVENLFTSGYGKAGKMFYRLAIQSYKSGDYFPIWGTCQGLELMSSLTAGKNILATMGAVRESLNVTFQEGYKNSRLFGNAPDEILTALQTKAATYNFHDYSLTPTNFSKSEKLKKMFSIIATSVTDHGREFIAILEAKGYPFYASQFHPEKPVFEWDLTTKLKHDMSSIKISQYLANFFVSEARKSLHSFPDAAVEGRSLIYNYPPVFTDPPSDSFIQAYFFHPNKQ